MIKKNNKFINNCKDIVVWNNSFKEIIQWFPEYKEIINIRSIISNIRLILLIRILIEIKYNNYNINIIKFGNIINGLPNPLISNHEDLFNLIYTYYGNLKEVIPNYSVEDYIGYWISGFITGDGHLYSILRNKTPYMDQALEISVHWDDITVLYIIQIFFGCGHIYLHKNVDVNNKQVQAYKYKVGNRFDLVNKVIPIMDKYPLKGMKYISYLKWKKIIMDINKKGTSNSIKVYGSKENARNIVSINTYYSEDVKLIPINECNWPFIIGLIESDGCYVSTNISNYYIDICQNINNKILLVIVQNYINKFVMDIYNNKNINIPKTKYKGDKSIIGIYSDYKNFENDVHLRVTNMEILYYFILPIIIHLPHFGTKVSDLFYFCNSILLNVHKYNETKIGSMYLKESINKVTRYHHTTDRKYINNTVPIVKVENLFDYTPIGFDKNKSYIENTINLSNKNRKKIKYSIYCVESKNFCINPISNNIEFMGIVEISRYMNSLYPHISIDAFRKRITRSISKNNTFKCFTFDYKEYNYKVYRDYIS